MKAVFLDRDGVIVEDVGYHYNTSDCELFEDAGKAIKRLNEIGYLVIVISNQSGVGRKYFTKDDVDKFNIQMMKELTKVGAKIDHIYYCPHHPNDNCNCRKPKPGMINAAGNRYSIELHKSWMVGNQLTDVLAGKAAGCKTIFIGSEKPGEANKCAKNLNEAVEYILRSD